MVKGLMKRIMALLMVVVFAFSAINYATVTKADQVNTVVSLSADVAFVIDTTGSMGRYIAKVKENLTDFVKLLGERNVDVRVKFIRYSDITNRKSGEMYSTSSSRWYKANETADATQYLENMKTGYGCNECTMDALAYMMEDSDFGVRAGGTAAKFCILLTDEDYYNDFTPGASYENKYGTSTERPNKIAEALNKKGIHTSLICTKIDYERAYAPFQTRPTVESAKDGGLFADIAKDDYKILLQKDLVSVIEERTQKVCSNTTDVVKIKSNMVVLKNYEGAKYSALGWHVNSSGTLVADESLTINKQESCVLKGLSPATCYTFTIKKADNTEMDMTFYTEPATGARFNNIPDVVYEGEVYNVKPGKDINKMMATPGAEISYSCTSDCVKVTKDKSGNGCEVQIIDAEYNTDKLVKVDLIAEVKYSQKQSDGTEKMKNAKFVQRFGIENEVDAMETTEFHGTSENVMTDGIIHLVTKDKVRLDVMLNQGELADTPTFQKLTYFMSDKYGFKKANARKIAKVDSKGNLTGVAPGLTYLTIAVKRSYNKFYKDYIYKMTVPVICPRVETSGFVTKKVSSEADAAWMEDDVLKVYDDSADDTDPEWIGVGHVKTNLNLKKFVTFNPTNAFNQANMKIKWTSTDPSIATVSVKGIVKFKKPGYVSIVMNPIGGNEYNLLTGKPYSEIKPSMITFKVQDAYKDNNQSTEATTEAHS